MPSGPHRKAHALALALVALAIAACATPPPMPSSSVSPSADEPAPPVGGNGWTLIRTVDPTTVNEGLAVAPLGADQYLLSITVVGGGSDGCNSPTLVGFRPSGTELVAEIQRSPTPPNVICATTSAVTYYVVLQRIIVTPAITHVALSESCVAPGCPVPVPRP